MAITKLAVTNSTVVATTGLNNLAAGGYSGVLTEVDNATDRYLYGILQLLLGADLTCAVGSPYAAAFLIPSYDGTNYPNPPATTGIVPATYPPIIFAGNSSAVFRSAVSERFDLPPLKFKFNTYHGLHGATAWGTGNTLTLIRFNIDIT